MRILQFGKYYPPDFGGIETVTQLLTEGLNEAGVSCDVLCSSSKPKTTVDQYEAYRVIRVACFGTIFSVPLSPELIRWLWKIGSTYDVIHLHLPNPLAELAIFLVRPRAKLVLHWHSDVDAKKFGMLAKFHAPLTRWIIKRATKIIGATRAHIDCSDHKEIMIGKSSIIPYPFKQLNNAQSYLVVKQPDILKLHNRFIILSIGRLIYYKGFKYLIEAAKYLPPKCLVLIVGTGPLAVELQDQIDSDGLSDRVVLVGKLKQSDLTSYLSICNVLCFPSTDRGEMFGMVQLEAMAFEKPVIGTRIPYSGVCEVNLNNVTGITVPIKDSNALAEAILKLMNDPYACIVMGQAGSRRVKEVYDVSVVIPQFISLFEECINV